MKIAVVRKEPAPPVPPFVASMIRRVAAQKRMERVLAVLQMRFVASGGIQFAAPRTGRAVRTLVAIRVRLAAVLFVVTMRPSIVITHRAHVSGIRSIRPTLQIIITLHSI